MGLLNNQQIVTGLKAAAMAQPKKPAAVTPANPAGGRMFIGGGGQGGFQQLNGLSAPTPATSVQATPSVAMQSATAPIGAGNLNLGNAPTVSAASYTPAQQAQHVDTAAFNTAPTQTTGVTQNVNPNSLTSNNMTNLLQSNSPYMQAAVTRAKQMGNSRGLLNSSMTVGAAEQAAINSALPIARADAGVNQQQSLTNQQYLNTADKLNAQLTQQAGISNAGQNNQMAQFNSRATDAVNNANVSTANASASFNTSQQNAIAQGNQNAIGKYDLGNQSAGVNSQVAGTQAVRSMVDSYMNAYQSIQTDASLTAAAKSTALANIKAQMNRATAAMSAVNTASAKLPTINWA